MARDNILKPQLEPKPALNLLEALQKTLNEPKEEIKSKHESKSYSPCSSDHSDGSLSSGSSYESLDSQGHKVRKVGKDPKVQENIQTFMKMST